jgi:hypothetical protein
MGWRVGTTTLCRSWLYPPVMDLWIRLQFLPSSTYWAQQKIFSFLSTPVFQLSIDAILRIKIQEGPKYIFLIFPRECHTLLLCLWLWYQIPSPPPPKKKCKHPERLFSFFIYFRTYVRRKPSYKTRQKEAQALDKDFHYPMYTTVHNVKKFH